jgi:heat shock protein HslJ
MRVGKESVMNGRELSWCLVLCASMVAGVTDRTFAQETEFPFDGELILDVNPMPGSKRIPIMNIAADGRIDLEMWCNRVDGQVVVAGDTITVMTGQATDRPCPPERAQGDAALLEALLAVTNWRREGDFVRLLGPRTLRFRVPTN